MVKKLLSQETPIKYVLESMEEAVIIADHNFKVKYVNPAAEKYLELEGITYEDKELYSDLDLIRSSPAMKKTILEQVWETGEARKGVIWKLKTGQQLSLNIIPLFENGAKKGVLITAQDVTGFLQLQHELDMAFALTLPNSKVEYKLKNTVEYRDVYNPHTKLITVTGVIKDGGYRHVVNCLRLLSNLYELGVTEIIGIEKDLLVEAFIFHDLGKSQPALAVGDEVDPKQVFEDGKLHAYRGAEIAKNFYHVREDIIEIIRYHHHGEQELPDTFPWRLRPMFRLFQLVDGLSAAITRGAAEVAFKVQDCSIIVTEKNARPQYNGIWQINLFTGEKNRLSE